ncbi:unnamed protein product, partial [Brassica oleracea var. botrytis]
MRGAVPASRIAAYRVCAGECRDDILLSAFDDAIADGVDIITISVGSTDVYPLEEDPIAIGAFHAILTIQHRLHLTGSHEKIYNLHGGTHQASALSGPPSFSELL